MYLFIYLFLKLPLVKIIIQHVFGVIFPSWEIFMFNQMSKRTDKEEDIDR